MPITGVMPMHMPVLTSIWKKRLAATPTHTSMLIVLFERGPHHHAADDDNGEQKHDEHARDHAELFARNGENEVGVLAGQRADCVCAPWPETETGGLSAMRGILASGRLPCDAPAVGVDAGIVRRENTQALVLIEEVVPEERDRKRDRRAADEEPVEPDAPPRSA